ncbi:MAG: type II toxin-antitoxin system Phd/YefM family antitoxin [Terriglobales bacterium]
MTIGVRELKDNLSAYLRKVERGATVLVAVHGRAVARLAPLASAAGNTPTGLDALIAAGLVRPPLDDSSPLAGWKPLQLRPGTASAWLDEDRDER